MVRRRWQRRTRSAVIAVIGAIPVIPAIPALAALAALTGSAVLLPSAGVAQTSASPAPIVRALEIRSDAPVDVDEVRELISLAVGEPMDEARTRRTLRSLRYSGLASEVEIYARPAAPDGVVAVVALWTDVPVTVIEVTGDLGLKKTRLLEVLPQRTGQPLREDRLLRGVYRLQDLLIEEGFRDAEVRLAVALGDEDDEAGGEAKSTGARGAAVTYRIAAGQRTKVRAVAFAGATPPFTDAELGDALRSQPDTPFRQRVAADDVERLQSWLFSHGYREAVVERLPETLDPAAHAADLAFTVRLGPQVEFSVQGVTLRELEKNDLVPFLGDSGYDEALVLQSMERIRRHFQEKGHYRVTVNRTEERSPDVLRLAFEVDPGPRLVLDDVGFEGNASYGADRLRRLMTTSARRFLLPGSGRLVDEELSADLANLRSFYLLEGFDQSQVGPARIAEKGDRLEVVVPIAEGRRRQVARLVLGDLAPLAEAAVREVLPLRDGGPFHRLLLERSVDALRALFEDRGYGNALVAAEVEWSADDLQATVHLRVFAGEQWVVDRILLRGLGRTDPGVVRRFLGIEAGDPVRQAEILELQRRLYKLGIFTRVDVRLAPDAEGSEARELLVDLEEGRSRSVQVGAGYDSESGVRGLLRLSQGNLFGKATAISLDLLGGQKDQHFRLIYSQPYIGGLHAELLATLYDEHEDRPDFVVDRRGGQLVVGRELGRWSLQAFASYRLVELEAEDEFFNDEIPLDSRNARVASVTPTANYDRRDDPLDPTRGWNGSFQLEYAFPALAADANFLKLFGQATAYLPLGRLGVLASSARGGAIEPLAGGASATPRDALEASVPAAELFYAGGRTTHRAYRRDELGIVGETVLLDPEDDTPDPYPAGGGGLALFNFEYRFPVAGPVGGTLFLDAGNVWTDYRDVRSGGFKWGAGLGVRYLSPVGPLRLEIGWKLDREPFEDPYVWFISLGNPF
ncbi:MAG: BamA/TamA family outer membrane protein [Acidobacteriota bacterium]|nr:BamA/TamA family outer membrane protein [Acidobacteriota bacterium]